MCMDSSCQLNFLFTPLLMLRVKKAVSEIILWQLNVCYFWLLGGSFYSLNVFILKVELCFEFHRCMI